MKNRAKCKICKEVLESFHEFDFVTCKCGEISICGGNIRLEVSAKSFDNFLRIDDLGNEIKVTVRQPTDPKTESSATEELNRPSKKDLLDLLDNMIKTMENLPQNALHNPVTHYDMISALFLISALFNSDSCCSCRTTDISSSN